MRGIDWEVRLMKPRALNLLPLSLPRPRVFSESEWVGMGGHGLWGDAPRRTEQLYSNHIKHPTNPAGSLGIINLQPSCACRTRLNPAPSLSPAGLGAQDRLTNGRCLGLRLATPEINHVSSCGRFDRLGAQAATGAGQSSVRASRRLSGRGRREQDDRDGRPLAAPWRRSQRPSSRLAGRTGREEREGRQATRPSGAPSVSSARIFLQVSFERAK